MYGNVIPIFAHRMLDGLPITIHGDGEQTRDFVNVRDVAEANYRAAVTPGASGAYNLGSGSRISINRLVHLLCQATGVSPRAHYGPPRKGDVRDSLADITAARVAFGYEPTVQLGEGLTEYIRWLREERGVQGCVS